MSILHIVGAKVWGGGEQYVFDMCDELHRRDVDVSTLIDKRNRSFYDRFITVSKTLVSNLYALQGLPSLYSVAKKIKEEGITSIHCHSGKYILLCIFLKKLTGAKLYFYKHNIIARKSDSYHQWIESQVDGFICVSQCVYNAQVNPKSSDKYHLIYNGVNTYRFPEITNEIEYNSNDCIDKPFIIGYAGRIIENKGIFILLEAMNMLHQYDRNIQLKICGDGKEIDIAHMNQYIKDRSMESYVEYMGFQKDMNHFYRAIDCLVAPSKVKEAFGLVLCEAMYCKTLVIASRSGAQYEIIENGVSGILLDDVTPDEIYNVLISLLNTPERRKKIILNGFQRVNDTFTIKKMVDRICNLICES